MEVLNVGAILITLNVGAIPIALKIMKKLENGIER